MNEIINTILKTNHLILQQFLTVLDPYERSDRGKRYDLLEGKQRNIIEACNLPLFFYIES